MYNLLSLELHGNGLSGELPGELFNLKKLQLLNLGEQYGQGRLCNQTDGTVIDIDYRMGGIITPRELNFGLTGVLGDSITKLSMIKGLYLHKNAFEGELPENIGDLRYLIYLWLE